MSALEALKIGLKDWFDQHQLNQYYREYARNNEVAVADAMWHLNRFARHIPPRNPQRENIYKLKTALIRLWYEQGRAISITKEKQTFDCWSCFGTGIYEVYDGYEDDKCYKCGGTGIYRQHMLYRFTFQIGSTNYVWHQPESLVTWAIELADKTIGTYENSKSYIPRLDSDVAKIQFIIVQQYLEANGVYAVPDLHIRLISVLKHAFEHTRLYRWFLRHQILWMMRKPIPRPECKTNNDDIPF